MSSILEKMKVIKNQMEVAEEKNKLKNHPVTKESIEIKNHYLNGLALMMNVNDNISDLKKDFFILLIEIFEIDNSDNSTIADFLSFAKEPENEQIVELLKELAKFEIVKVCFMTDIFIIAHKDGEFDKEEKELIDVFYEMLAFEKEEIDFIQNELFEISKKENYPEIFYKIGRYFTIKFFNIISNENKAYEFELDDIDVMFSWIKIFAEQGNLVAQYYLGECYYSGYGVEKNVTKVIKWFRRSAEQGYSLAQCWLGRCYRDGYGVEKDTKEAIQWFKLAAEQGDSNAQCCLGKRYQDGEGVKEDIKEAIKWFKLSAKQGYFEAQHFLGACYKDGNGVKKDMKKAIKLFKRSAEQGHFEAQHSLGVCYQYGDGVKKDMKKAIKLFKFSAEQGDSNAIDWLDREGIDWMKG